jgi:hypothetical protein
MARIAASGKTGSQPVITGLAGINSVYRWARYAKLSNSFIRFCYTPKSFAEDIGGKLRHFDYGFAQRGH